MTQPVDLRELARGLAKFSTVASRVLSDFYYAQDGPAWKQVIAGASGLGAVLDAVLPDESRHERLMRQGYSLVQTDMGAFFCALLHASELPRHAIRSAGGAARTVVWDLPADGSVAAIYDEDEFQAGPYVRPKDSSMLSDALRKVVWARSRDLMLTASRAAAEFQDARYQLDVMPELSARYHGDPSVEWTANRLRRRQGQTRTMLLVGPTGVGKSMLARWVAREVAGEDAKVLKIASGALATVKLHDVLALVDHLRPTVLLLDDVSPASAPWEGEETDYLGLFEALRGRAQLVIGTVMQDRAGRSVDSRDGADYFSGMRPGRVDEVVHLKRPSPKLRERILLDYLGGVDAAARIGLGPALLSEIVAATDGLTGAYLMDLAVNRLMVHGVATWKSEVAALKRQAPRPARPRRAIPNKKLRLTEVVDG
jgi:hypothetical protein